VTPAPRLHGLAGLVFAVACTAANPDQLKGATADGGGRPEADAATSAGDADPGPIARDDAQRPGADDGPPPAPRDDLGVEPDDASSGGAGGTGGSGGAGGEVPPEPGCAEGEIDQRPCGLNTRGLEERTCAADGTYGPWGACSDTDECFDDVSQTQACGVQGNGEQQRTCNIGRWSAWAPCDDPDRECADGTVETVPCGLNGRGVQAHACEGGRYGAWSECMDPDTCVDSSVDTGACGVNRRGQRSRICFEGEFGEFGACRDPDACRDGSTERRACGINGRGTEARRCDAGQWSDYADCDDPDECLEGTSESRNCPAGGRQTRSCVEGAWTNFSACPADDVCAAPAQVGLGVTSTETFETDALTSNCNGSDRGERVVAFTAPQVGVYRFSLGAGRRTASLAIRAQCGIAGSELGCLEPDARGDLEQPMAGGQTYFLVIESTLGAQDVEVVIEAVDLVDPCLAALPLFAGESRGNTAGDDDFDATCANASGPERIYRFAPLEAGLWRMTTIGSAFDTVLSVRTTCDDPDTTLACNDDVGDERYSELYVQLGLGELVYVLVDGFDRNASGAFTLLLQRVEPLPTEMESREVPAGLFRRGSSANNSPLGERPQRDITVSRFVIDRREVTVAEYEACVLAGRCAEPEGGDNDGCTWGDPEVYADHPINCLTWTEAGNYCAQVGKRLPTEAEWEKAARGGCDRRGQAGCDAADAVTYPWGNEPAPQCTRVQRENCDEGLTAPVGSTDPDGNSIYGVIDLAGNASEWVQDCYDEDYYEASPALDPVNDAPECGNRVTRGGQSTEAENQNFRVARRVAEAEGASVGGVRCVR